MANNERENCAGASTCSKESCEGCPSAAGAKEKPNFRVDANAFTQVKHVIGIVSGKGGVGKSFVTASLANRLAGMGYSVGIMDADITGPSIPKMYGLTGLCRMTDDGILPRLTDNGIKVVSLNLLMPDPEQAVIWRGPLIAGVVKQFWTDVIWGELDFLLIDMPPGTGDVPLTVFQSLPVDGIMVVTSPQDLVQLIVTKALNMAKMMNIPVLGILENYSYMVCPDCGKKISVFGESHLAEEAEKNQVPVLGTLPLDPSYARTADEGKFGNVLIPELDQALQALRQCPAHED